MPFVSVSAQTIYDTILASFEVASTWLGRWYSVFAEEFKKFTDRVYQLANESVPGMSQELLSDWVELLVANNDEWELIKDSEDDQRAFVHGKHYNEGRLVNAQFFIDYADVLDFTVTVDEYPLQGEIAFCSVTDDEVAATCGIAVDPVAQPTVYGCGFPGAFNVVEITITAGTGNLELM